MTVRLWPRSLAGQLMLVTGLTLLMAQAVNMTLLAAAQRHERITAIASGAAMRISDVTERIALGQPLPVFVQTGSPPHEIDKGLPPSRSARHFGMRRISIGDRPMFRPGMADWPEVATQVTRLIDDNSEVRQIRAARMPVPRGQGLRSGHRQLRGGEAVAVAAQVPDGRWITVRAHVPDHGPFIGTLLIGQTLILFGLLLGPLLFVAWRVSRPLSQLARATADVGPGFVQPELPETGPQDVRDLTRAFNHMRQRIMAMLEDKDRMLGAIGHDLRTPLASLRIRVEQLGDVRLRDQMVATIEDMAAMLNDILSLARAGQPREKPELTDISALLANIVEEYQAMGRPVTLAAEGATSSRTLRASALRGAVRNLIDNAVSYGGAAVVGLTMQADGALAICIDDDGPGIPPDQMAAMLEPFARAEHSRNRDSGGSGLGLALARAAAQAEGGELSISNRQPHGLSARIILPDQT